MNVICSQDVSL